jgi:hypothetical protein
MNATERDQLQQFLNALRQTRADPKDPTADGLISDAFRAQADAPYLLVQRAMGLGMALDAAQTRIAQLEAQSAQQLAQLAQWRATPATAPAHSGSWMSGAQAWGRGPETPAPPMPVHTATTHFGSSSPVATRPAATPAPAPTSAWGGGMMAQVATTAAGVVAGGLLFQGVQNLMGHNKPSPAPNAEASPANSLASPSGNAQDESLPGLVSPQASADDAGDSSWDSGEDWA